MHVERVAVRAGEHAFAFASGAAEFKRKKPPPPRRMTAASHKGIKRRRPHGAAFKGPCLEIAREAMIGRARLAR